VAEIRAARDNHCGEGSRIPSTIRVSLQSPSVAGVRGTSGASTISSPASLVSVADLTLVVPLFNESARFPMYAPELRDFIAERSPRSEIVFVDDGSTDDTAALVEKFIALHALYRMRLVCRPHAGKGAAVAAGLGSAANDVAAFCDLDLATPLAELARIVDAADHASILAVGSRGAATSRITRHQSRGRELLGECYNRAVQLTLVPGIVDTQCGAKAARSAVWRRILPMCREDGLAWDVEVIAIARALGVTVQEIGIEWHHKEGSRIRPVRDGVKMLCAIPRIRRHLRSTLNLRSKGDAGGGAFDDENASMLAEADTHHWWFRSKATFVSMLMRRYAPDDGWLVDIGAGPGGVTAMLGWAPGQTLALEGNVELVRETRRRHALVAMVGDAAQLPLSDGSANVVCLLDVIEHLSDPLPTIREAARILADAGRLVVNVPAHPHLWSAADEVLGHARRYTRRSLRADLERGGLEVLWMSHVFSWLALPVWLKRRATPGAEPQLGLDMESSFLDFASLLLTRMEWAIASRVSLPIGTSVLCVCARAGAE
jgi:dolichyl-phosphate beta-glucosyltransferase